MAEACRRDSLLGVLSNHERWKLGLVVMEIEEL